MDKKLNQTTFCKICKNTINQNFEHCKKCNLQKNIKIFYFDIKSKNNKWKNEGQVQKVCYSPNSQRISRTYHIHHLEKTIFDNLKFTRFSTLEHLTSYIVYSNKFPLSQFIFHLAPELKNIPQVKSIMMKNIRRVTCNSSISNNFKNLLPATDSSLELLSKPWFWIDLIRLHISNYSVYARLNNLNTFDRSKMPQTLLIAIYYSGYQYREEKPTKLTEYMDRLFDLNLKKVIYKPSFSNLQALYIYMSEYFGCGKISLSRACLAHAIRMSYTLGINVETNRFSKNLAFERKNFFRELSTFDLLSSGSFRFKPNYVVELPTLDPNLYRTSKYLIPSNFHNYEFKNHRLDTLMSIMNSLKKLYDNKTIELIRFDFISTTNDIKLEKLCMERINSLESSYKQLEVGLRKLKIDYSEYVNEIENFEIDIIPGHFHIALIILEYGRINQFNPSQILLRETLKVCDKMYFYLEKDPDPPDFYKYLLCFTYLTMLKQLDKIENGIIICRVNYIFNTLSPNDEFYNLNYLLLSSALKIIKS